MLYHFRRARLRLCSDRGKEDQPPDQEEPAAGELSDRRLSEAWHASPYVSGSTYDIAAVAEILEGWLGLLKPPMVAQQCGQLADAFPILAAIDRVFDERHARRGQHDTGELTEFLAYLGFGKGSLKIAAVAVASPRRLTAVAQGHADPRRAQPRGHGTHRRIFRDLHALTQCRDGGIPRS